MEQSFNGLVLSCLKSFHYSRKRCARGHADCPPIIAAVVSGDFGVFLQSVFQLQDQTLGLR